MPTNPRALSFPVLLGLAWAVTAAVLLAQRWPEMEQRLFDADDAMRLVEVRAFLAGHGWFDLHEARLDPPTGYDGHWSRLIDAGLAALYLAARPFVTAELAEQLMRALWPLLWLLVAMGSVAGAAWRIGGRGAALIALLLSACALPAFQHFKPGRIDHHNVQIALALAAVAAACWADRMRYAAALAGALSGMALAIGLENVPFTALVGVALAVRLVLGPVVPPHYGAGLVAGTAAGFLLVVPPAHWGRPACDAIAVNWLVPVVIAGAGLCIVAAGADRRTALSRGLALFGIGVAATAAFVLIEPRCIGGPFALTDQAVKLLWLNGVDETESLLSVARSMPMTAAWLATFPLVALVAAAGLVRDAALRRDFAFWLCALALALALALTVGAAKLYAYAMWFALPLVAALVARLTASSPRVTLAARLAAAILLTPTIVTAGAITFAQAVGGAATRAGLVDRAACTRNAAYGALARLPAGLVATEINYGPYVLALTPHAVMAAPYHRLSGGVIAAHAILNGTPDEAKAVAIRHAVAYVAVCGRHTSTGIDPGPGSLWADLRAGRPPAWLAPVNGTRDDETFAVYRVVR